MIKPEVGMPVLYTPNVNEELFCGRPCAAHIAYVWADSSVNLVVTDMYGNSVQRHQVLLWQVGDNDMRETLGRWCQFPEWFVRVMNPAPPAMLVQMGGLAHDQLARDLTPAREPFFVSLPMLQPVLAGTPDNIQGKF